jgi:hypothetical protein
MANPARLVRALSSAVLASALVPGVAPRVEADQTGSLRIQATVLARALLDAQRSPAQVVISQEDVARGYHDVAEPVDVDFRSNHPNGVVLAFAWTSPLVEGIEAQASEAGVPLSAGASVYVPQRSSGFRARSVSLKLRLKLAPDAAPGAMPFPVKVSLAPR